MDYKLEKELYKKYPQLFQDRTKSPQETLMCFGLECRDGWFQIIDTLCENIMKTNPDKDFRFSQVKSKFGGLRIYSIGPSNNKIDDLINEAELKSYHSCEECGVPSKCYSANWVYNMCQKCWLNFAIKRKIKEWTVQEWLKEDSGKKEL